MKGNEVKDRILNDPDFIYLKRYDFSLQKLAERHPNGVPDKVVAAALMITEEDVEDTFNDIIAKLRLMLKIEV